MEGDGGALKGEKRDKDSKWSVFYFIVFLHCVFFLLHLVWFHRISFVLLFFREHIHNGQRVA